MDNKKILTCAVFMLIFGNLFCQNFSDGYKVRNKITHLLKKIESGHVVNCEDSYLRKVDKLLNNITGKELEIILCQSPTESVYVILMEFCIETPQYITEKIVSTLEERKDGLITTCHYVSSPTIAEYLCFRSEANKVEIPIEIRTILNCKVD